MSRLLVDRLKFILLILKPSKKGLTMKRTLVLFVVLLSLGWMAVGCGQRGPGATGPTEPPSKEQMDKMLEGQRQIEMEKQKPAAGQPK